MSGVWGGEWDRGAGRLRSVVRYAQGKMPRSGRRTVALSMTSALCIGFGLLALVNLFLCFRWHMCATVSVAVGREAATFFYSSSLRWTPTAAGPRFEAWRSLGGFDWAPWMDHYAGAVRVNVPLWIPLVVTGLPACILGRLEWRARQALRVWRCACGYDRRGLAMGAQCPECGAVPARG